MRKNELFKIAIFLIFIIFIFGCVKKIKEKPAETEEITDTGILAVESSPASAQVYVDGELKGRTPFTLYNVPVGYHNVVVKEEGYSDFEKTVSIKVGRTEQVDATLTTVMPIKAVGEANKPIEEKIPENTSSTQKLNTINISKSFIMYFDFDKELFTEVTTATPDVFSTKYDAYVYFTAESPARMRILNKQIKDVKKEDCINADNTIGNLYSGQTLCVKTTEGLIAAIGGSWKTSPTELEWVLFS